MTLISAVTKTITKQNKTKQNITKQDKQTNKNKKNRILQNYFENMPIFKSCDLDININTWLK